MALNTLVYILIAICYHKHRFKLYFLVQLKVDHFNLWPRTLLIIKVHN